MPHYNAFTQSEINSIKKLLDAKQGKSKSKQLAIRNKLRGDFGFYISDFSSIRPYTSEALDEDIRNGIIDKITILPECDNVETGWPKDIFEILNRSAGQYLRLYNNVKVGITANPRRRMAEHIKRTPSMHWERMVVRYSTSSINNANAVEDWFIEHRKDIFVNEWTGKSWMTDASTYYVYFLLGDSK